MSDDEQANFLMVWSVFKETEITTGTYAHTHTHTSLHQQYVGKPDRRFIIRLTRYSERYNQLLTQLPVFYAIIQVIGKKSQEYAILGTCMTIIMRSCGKRRDESFSFCNSLQIF